VGLTIRVLADNSLKTGGVFVTGGNEKDIHLTNVALGRDFQVESFNDLRCAEDEDPCPRCKQGTLAMSRGIEVGHIFKLGTKYSKTLGATFLDAQGKSQDIIMGCYGIGVGRTVAAAIEQNHDQNGIIFPESIAPFQVIISSVKPKEPAIQEASEKLYTTFLQAGIDVLIDDRDERPGIKFKDADLIGIPLRVTVGTKIKDGLVDIKQRYTKDGITVKETDALDKVKELLISD